MSQIAVDKDKGSLKPARLSYRRPLFAAVALAFTSLILYEYLRPGLLLVGNITVDVVEGKDRVVGGAVSYAAVVARAYGVRACVVTAAGSDADLSVFGGHEVHAVKAKHTLTFEHTYTWWGNKRKLKVTAQPNVTLTMQHVPRHCRRARVALLGPLTQKDLDAASFVNHKQGWWDRMLRFRQHVGLMAQGQQRALDSAGRVMALKTPSPDLVAALGPQTSVFLSDVETDVWAPGTVANLSLQSARWLVTRGELGADEVTGGETVSLPPEKVVAVDTNGAGDTFATAYMLALASHSLQPGAIANWAASRAVQQPQSCKPSCIEASIQQGSRWARFATWLQTQGQRAHACAAAMGRQAQSLPQCWSSAATRVSDLSQQCWQALCHLCPRLPLSNRLG